MNHVDHRVGIFTGEELRGMTGKDFSEIQQIVISKADENDMLKPALFFDDFDHFGDLFKSIDCLEFKNAVFLVFLADCDVLTQCGDAEIGACARSVNILEAETADIFK